MEVVLLVDRVNTNFTSVSFERGQIERFLKADGGELPRPVSLAVLSDSGMTIGSLTTLNGNALATELDRNKAGLRSINRS